MNYSKRQPLFFTTLPELRKLCALKITLSSQTAENQIRTAQRKICRQLLLLHQDILCSPVPGTSNQILVVMTIPYYKSGKCQAYVEKHGATIDTPERVIPAVFQTCLSYTLIAKLAPSWNQAGRMLIQGKDFLSQSGKQNAVVLDINVSETQICISVEVCKVRLPPPELEDFNISANILKRFVSDKNAVIKRHFILSNWCYVLPSMKMGQIISISHIIPSESPFQSYRDLQLHWENLYGYILPEASSAYCNIYFKMIGEQLFTYPLSCIRSQPVQYFPRVDLDGVLNDFLTDLKTILPDACGFPLKMTSKALYATSHFTQSSVQKVNSKPANLTGKRNHQIVLIQEIPKKAEEGNTGVMGRKSYSRKWKTSDEPAQPVHSTESFKMLKYLFEDSVKKDSTKIIPIFKGKLLQIDRQTTKAFPGKKKQTVPQNSPKVKKTNTATKLNAFKASEDQVNKALHSVLFKKITSRNVLQAQIGQTNIKWGLKEKSENGEQMSDCTPANGIGLERNSSEIKSRTLNSLTSTTDKSMHHALVIQPPLHKPANLRSSNKEGRKTASHITPNTGSKKTLLCISGSHIEVTNSKLFQKQSRTEEENTNAYRLSNSVYSKNTRGGDKKESVKPSNQDTINISSSQLQFKNLQMLKTNESLCCKDVNLSQIYSDGEIHLTSAPDQAGRKHQIKKEGGSYLKPKKPRTIKPAI